MGLVTGKPEPTVTRVERQCSGISIPSGLRTLGDIVANAAEFDPFKAMIFEDAKVQTDTQNWKAQKWLMSLGLKTAVEEYGLTIVRARLNRQANAAKFFAKYSELLSSSVEGVNNDSLFRAYQRSTVFQLNLPCDGRRPQGRIAIDI